MMTRSQAAAFVFAQSVAALAEIEAMKAENARREKGGYSQAYGEKDFLAVPDKYGIGQNAVLKTFGDAILG